ncbi:Protein Mpv17 [Frankliniella fusca]|uniref:Mitochondrial inner membrane protein Mpv17 n=1 Tax=Frankliniella fusca TaxID=407009 RepID=A0AAE1GRI6_9NEOP|nr:Protein Mpv17 [Frankliniella fusca]
MRTLLRLYQNAVQRYPMSAQAAQTGLLMTTGDIVAQTVIDKRGLHDLDVGRIARFGAIGACLVGPSLHTWYGFMERHIGAAGVNALVKKVCADQLIFAPSFIVVLLSTIGLSQGKSVEQVKEQLTATYPDVLINNYKLWPAVQLFNFWLTPLQYRVVVVQLVAIFWNTYLSWKTNPNQGDLAVTEKPNLSI